MFLRLIRIILAGAFFLAPTPFIRRIALVGVVLFLLEEMALLSAWACYFFTLVYLGGLFILFLYVASVGKGRIKIPSPLAIGVLVRRFLITERLKFNRPPTQRRTREIFLLMDTPPLLFFALGLIIVFLVFCGAQLPKKAPLRGAYEKTIF